MVTRSPKQSQTAWARETAPHIPSWGGANEPRTQSPVTRGRTGDFSPTLLATFITEGRTVIAGWKPSLSAKERANSIAAPANSLLDKLGCPGCHFDAIPQFEAKFSAQTWTVQLEEASLLKAMQPAQIAYVLSAVAHEIYHAYQRYLAAMFLLETNVGRTDKNVLSELSLSPDIIPVLLDKYRARQQARISLTESQRREAMAILMAYRAQTTQKANNALDKTRANYSAALRKLNAIAKKGSAESEYDTAELGFKNAWREYVQAQLAYEKSPLEIKPYEVLDEVYTQLGIPAPNTNVEMKEIAESILRSMREIWTLSRRR